jgi:hypothetical protein
MTRALTTPDQIVACAEHLYHVWHGYYMLQEVNADLFGYVAPGCGFHDVRPLTYDEALTIRLTPRHGLRLVAPGWVE